MPEQRVVTVYSDYKSPYAYLAKDLTYALAEEFPITLDWKPYVLDIPQYLGSAVVDAAGHVLEENRNPHQWRRVRYSYMDCRRQARKLGLIIRGTRKIWDSSLAAAGDAVRPTSRCTGVSPVSRRRVRALLASRPGPRVGRRDCLGASGGRRRRFPLRRLGRYRPCRGGPIATTPNSRACSACRASSWTENCSGAANISRTSEHC